MNHFRAMLAVMVLIGVFSWIVAPEMDALAQEKKAQDDAPKKAPRRWREILDPLHIAAYENDVEQMKRLLAAKDVDVNLRTDFRPLAGYTPLHMACYEGHARIVELLAAKKADLNLTETKMARTALHLAASHGRTEAVKALIKAGADLNVKDKAGNTALRLATDQTIVAALKKAGAAEE